MSMRSVVNILIWHIFIFLKHPNIVYKINKTLLLYCSPTLYTSYQDYWEVLIILEQLLVSAYMKSPLLTLSNRI